MDDGLAVSVQVGAGGAVVVHVFEVVVHGPQVGPGHVDVRVCMMVPVCAAGHSRVLV